MILCNPPWIPAEYLNDDNELDKGSYDPKGNFLRESFKIAGNINENFKNSKKIKIKKH